MRLHPTLRRDLHQSTSSRVTGTVGWDATHRRHFLRGAGGAMMTLPLLPSLFPKEARAQAGVRQKSFIGIPMSNGMTNGYNASEAEAKVTPSTVMPSFIGMTPTVAKHTVYSKDLTAAKNENPAGRISTIIDAAFNPYLSKMLMLQGLDYIFIAGHHMQQFCGPHNTDAATNAACPPIASIDQVMAYSKNFYKNPSLVGRSVVWTSAEVDVRVYPSAASTWADPGNKATSKIVRPPDFVTPKALWDKYFGNFMPPAAGPSKKQQLADLVLPQYKSLLGNPALGGEDKKKVQRHIELLNATQTQVAASAGCVKPNAPPTLTADQRNGIITDFPTRLKVLQDFNSLITSLIACGLCHSFLGHFWTYLVNDSEAWHKWSHEGPLQSEMDTEKGIYKDVGLDLAKKLDAQGLLDDSLIMIPQEHSKLRHESWNIGVVMIGGAGGAFKTGQYIDYRNMKTGDDVTRTRTGYIMNQLWANVLQAMDVPASEYEPLNRTSNALFSPTNSGYGGHNSFDWNNFLYTPYKTTFKGHNLSDPLPLLRV